MDHPGPGSYRAIDYTDMKNDRIYHLSQYKNPMTRKFGTSQRERIGGPIKDYIPGPGHYRPPSEFGYLDIVRGSPRGFVQNSPRGFITAKNLHINGLSETDSNFMKSR